MKIKCNKIKYDCQDLSTETKLPKTVTVDVSDDMINCCVDETEDEEPSVDVEEAKEFIADAIEEKTDCPVLSFEIVQMA